MSKSHFNQKRFIRRIANKIKKAKGKVEPVKEYKAIYPNASHKTAVANSSEVLNSEIGQKTLAEYLAKDFPKHKRSERLAELSYATKDHVLQDGTKVEIRDNPSSLKAIELVMKASGDIKDAIEVDNRSINYTITPDEAKRIGELADKLDRLEQQGRVNNINP